MPEKRIEVVAKAFTKLKDYKLIIVGDGMERDTIVNIIKNHKNITLLTDVSEEKLVELYANCFATIYLPVEEDFGLVPLEGMASGKICIAANEGGCKETVVHNKTGYLIPPTEQKLIDTVRKLKREKILKMKNDCILQAKKFDIKNIVKQWKELIYN